MPKDKGKIITTGTQSKDTLRWTKEMDSILLDSLLEQCTRGNFFEEQLSTTGYSEVLNALHVTFGPILRKEYIKNLLKTLKEHFGKCYDLFNAWSGISWDPNAQRFDVEPQVWKEIIEAKPEAAKWMRMKVSHYDKLYDLYAADRATGRYVESARETLKQWDKEGLDLNDSMDDVDTSQPNINWGNDTQYASNMETFSPSHGNSNQSQGTLSSKGSKYKVHMTDIIETQIEKMTKGINDLTDVMREGNYYYDRIVALAEGQIEIAARGLMILEQSRPHYYSEQDIWRELENFDMLPELE